jgi:hypothetical protein
MVCLLVVDIVFVEFVSRGAIDDLSMKHQTLGMTCGTSDADAVSLRLGEGRGARNDHIHTVEIKVK